MLGLCAAAQDSSPAEGKKPTGARARIRDEFSFDPTAGRQAEAAPMPTPLEAPGPVVPLPPFKVVADPGRAALSWVTASGGNRE